MDVVQLAQALIRRPSVTPKDAGAMQVLVDALEPAGFDCHVVPFAEDGHPETLNLWARLGGGERHFCFAGHVDVVPPGKPEGWKHDPFAAVVEDGYLYGRGAEDMKGAIAAFACAARRYARDCGGMPPGAISFLITGDEEGDAVNGTKKMLGWMDARGEKPSICLVGEPTNPEKLGEMMKIGRRGSLNAVLKIDGVQGHVAYPHLAENPLRPLLRILDNLHAAKLDDGTEYFPPSNLEVTSVDVDNHAHNVIPGHAEAKLNIRFNDLHSGESLVEWLHAQCRAVTPNYTLLPRISGEAFHTEPGRAIHLLEDICEELTGRRPALSTTGGTSDARFIKDICPVFEFGTTGSTAHKVDERVKVEDLRCLEEIYYRLLKRYFEA